MYDLGGAIPVNQVHIHSQPSFLGPHIYPNLWGLEFDGYTNFVHPSPAPPEYEEYEWFSRLWEAVRFNDGSPIFVTSRFIKHGTPQIPRTCGVSPVFSPSGCPRISRDYESMELNVAAGKFTGLKVRAHLSPGCNVGKLSTPDDFIPRSYEKMRFSLKKLQNMLLQFYRSYWNGTCEFKSPSVRILIQSWHFGSKIKYQRTRIYLYDMGTLNLQHIQKLGGQ